MTFGYKFEIIRSQFHFLNVFATTSLLLTIADATSKAGEKVQRSFSDLYQAWRRTTADGKLEKLATDTVHKLDDIKFDCSNEYLFRIEPGIENGDSSYSFIFAGEKVVKVRVIKDNEGYVSKLSANGTEIALPKDQKVKFRNVSASSLK